MAARDPCIIMAFSDEDLRSEIEEEFASLQEQFAPEVAASLRSTGRPGQCDLNEANPGFRVFCPNPPKSEDRKAAMRKWFQKHKLAEIRQALLRGERPKVQKGKRGRPPTRWIKVAAELGIDLGLPVETTTPALNQVSKSRRAAIVAARGEAPPTPSVA